MIDSIVYNDIYHAVTFTSIWLATVNILFMSNYMYIVHSNAAMIY